MLVVTITFQLFGQAYNNLGWVAARTRISQALLSLLATVEEGSPRYGPKNKQASYKPSTMVPWDTVEYSLLIEQKTLLFGVFEVRAARLS